MLARVKRALARLVRLGNIAGVPIIGIVVIAGLALTVATVIWYLQTHQPLSRAPMVRQLPGVNQLVVPPAPPFKFAIYGIERPVGIALSPDNGRIYATESGAQHVVHVYDRSGKQVATLAPPDTLPTQRVPALIAVSPDGKIYVSDTIRATVDIYNPDGSYVGELRPKGSDIGRVWTPRALAFAPDGTLYVTEITRGKHRVLAMDGNGNVKAEFGREGSKPDELSYSSGLALGANGLVYVSDEGNHRVQILDPRSGFTRSFKDPNGFSLPRGMAITGDLIYVSDTIGGVVDAFTREDIPKFLFSFGTDGRADGQFMFPEGLAADAAGRLYVCDRDNNRIQVFGFN